MKIISAMQVRLAKAVSVDFRKTDITEAVLFFMDLSGNTGIAKVTGQMGYHRCQKVLLTPACLNRKK